MTDHPLDQAIWNSLSSLHAHLATGDDRFRRYVPGIGPLAAIRDGSDESLASLQACVAKTGLVAMAQTWELALSPAIHVAWKREAVQLEFAGDAPDGERDRQIVPLGDGDAAEMLALATLTQPGPYAERTHEMGSYWGVRRDGRLVAMAGERVRLPGFTEISAICTHPDFRGAGLARALTEHAIRAILARGDTPFLHSFADNEGALRLYEALGFRRRMEFHATALEPA